MTTQTIITTYTTAPHRPTAESLDALRLEWCKMAITSSDADQLITIIDELGQPTPTSSGRKPANALIFEADNLQIYLFAFHEFGKYNTYLQAYNQHTRLFVTAITPGQEIHNGRPLARLEMVNDEWVVNENSLFVPGAWLDLALAQYPLAKAKINQREEVIETEARARLARLLWLDGAE